MKFQFVPMKEEYARKMIAEWKYEKAITLHDYNNEAEHLMDKESWGRGLFAVLNEDNQLIGELTTEFFDENDDYIEYTDYQPEKLNTAEMWIGFGLKPELTGKGQGFSFVSACIDYAVRKHAYKGEFVFLGVPEFNQRAIKVYKKVGFEVFNQVEAEVNGIKFTSIQMKKKITDQ
ncbi:MAG: GNAT family N-acetyltransferase [Anaerolineaceae bacterium]|nr:GNAT family N-acetyltransferase [Anaerolineaceae bacterium]